MTKRRVGAAVVLALFVALLASCNSGSSSNTTGGSGSPSETASASSSGAAATAWADQVCGDILTWDNAVKAGSSDFASKAPTASSIKQVRQFLVNFMKKVVQNTDTMIASVQSEGAPDVSGGAETAATLLTALKQVRAAFARFEKEAAHLPTDSPSKFSNAVKKMVSELQGQMLGIKSSIKALENAGLDAAFKSAQSCQTLSSGS